MPGDHGHPAQRMAITVIALAKKPHLLKDRLFNKTALLRDLKDFRPELLLLEKQGYIEKLDNNISGWQIRPAALQWWLANELVRTVRDEAEFAKWLQKQEFDGLLTKGEKEWLSDAGKGLGG